MSKKKILLKGLGASAGVVTGKVKLVNSPKDFSSFEEGNVLVAHITDPSMTLIIMKAIAIVTDIGGLTSHPAIVSRELGIPCVVATEKATQILKDGARVKVDGSKGEVYVLEK